MADGMGLSAQFEAHRAHLRAVAYRLLGSPTDADDALQDAWMRVSRTDATDIVNLRGWLTTIVARTCLNMLRARRHRREELVGVHMPDPIITAPEALQPEQQALLADSVGLAMLLVLDTLSPAERLAFVLHDMFAFPFEDIAAMVGRTPVATRQLASRARRRVKAARAEAERPDLDRQRTVVNAFFAAARGGDFHALVALLDPDVVLRADGGTWRPELSTIIRGPDGVARQAQLANLPNAKLHPALVNGSPGVVVTLGERPFAIMGFTIRDGKIVEINGIVDPERVAGIAGPFLRSRRGSVKGGP